MTLAKLIAAAKAERPEPSGLPLMSSGKLRRELGLDLLTHGREAWEALPPALVKFAEGKPAFVYRTSTKVGFKTFVDWYRREQPPWLIAEITTHRGRDPKSGAEWDARFIRLVNLDCLASAKVGRRKADFHKARKLGRLALARARAGRGGWDDIYRRMARLYARQGYALNG